MDSSDTEKENQLLEDDSQKDFLKWRLERIKLRHFIPRTLIHEESAGDVAEAAYKAGWRAAKLDEGYHKYQPPMNTLKDGCIVCNESPENTKHLRTKEVVDALRKRGWSDSDIEASFREIWDAGYDAGLEAQEG